MKNLMSEVAIRCTPMQLWSVLIDFASYPKWNPFIREASGSIEKDSCLRIKLRPHEGRSMTIRPMVLDVIPAERLRLIGQFWIPGLVDGEHDFRIEKIGSGHIKLRQSVEFRGLFASFLPAMVYKKFQDGFESMNRALRARVGELFHGGWPGRDFIGKTVRPGAFRPTNAPDFIRASPIGRFIKTGASY